MEYLNRYPGLSHFNKDELYSRVNYNEDNVNLLLKTYFKEFPQYIKRIRTGIRTSKPEIINMASGLIADSAEAVCFDIMHQLAGEVLFYGLSDKIKCLDIIDEMEVENEYLRDLVDI